MTAANQIAFSTPQRKVNERSTMVVTARFRDRATNADVTPTNVAYRLDGPLGEIIGWTSVTTSTSVSITISSTANQINNDARSLEERILTVAADRGLSTQFIDYMTYQVRNLPFVTA